MYIGQTSKSVQLRINYRECDIYLNKNTCLFAIHANTKKHVVHFESIKNLDTEQNTKKRKELF